MVGPLACPICRTRPPRRACGNRVFASAHCPVCLETCEPVVALPCGHALCEGCFGRIPGGALLVDGQSVGAAARPTEDARASGAQDRDATRQRHAEAEDAAARREAVERSRREAAEERERRAAVERSRRAAERARAELRAARDEAARREAARARERDEAARREAARAREAAARERPSYSAAFAVNQRVEVRWRGGNQWFTGKITAIRGDRLYDILYDDGESEARVAESLIRRWVSTPHTGAPASARPMERSRADAARDEAARREAARAREVAAERARAIFDRTKYPNGGPRHDQDPCCATVVNVLCMVLCPLSCPAAHGCADLVDGLTSLPCKFIPCSECDPNAMNPLWFCSQAMGWAATFGQLHTVMVLAKNGATLDRVNLAGFNARSDAEREGHQHIVRWYDEWVALGKPRNCPALPF